MARGNGLNSASGNSLLFGARSATNKLDVNFDDVASPEFNWNYIQDDLWLEKAKAGNDKHIDKYLHNAAQNWDYPISLRYYNSKRFKAENLPRALEVSGSVATRSLTKGFSTVLDFSFAAGGELERFNLFLAVAHKNNPEHHIKAGDLLIGEFASTRDMLVPLELVDKDRTKQFETAGKLIATCLDQGLTPINFKVSAKPEETFDDCLKKLFL